MARYKSRYTEGYFKRKNQGQRYDKIISNRFESFIWTLEKYFLRRIFKRYLKSNKNIAYMDFACGTGRVLSYLGKYIKNKTGVDTSEAMIRQAKKKIKAKFVKGNIVENKKLLKGKKYDLITSFRLFLNLEKKNRLDILKELRNYLKDDGYLVVNNHMNRYSFIGFQFWIRKNIFGQKLKRDTGKGIINTMSEREFKKTLRKAGYKIVNVYRFSLIPGRKGFILLREKVLWEAEMFLSTIPLLNLLAKDQIYVCKKK